MTGTVRSSRLAFVAFLAALLAACGSSNGSGAAKPAHPGAPSASLFATSSTVPGAAQNKADARAEADRLVATAALPPGAVRVSTQPAGLAGPAMGRPLISQLIDSVRYYRISMSLSQASAWFRAHPPHGFTQSGSESGTDAGISDAGFQYDVSHHLSWGSASLVISLASTGATSSATAIRVDGLAQWIDPTPVRVTSGVPTIRVTIAGGCPATDRRWGDVSNPGAADLDKQLLPAAAPTAALECTYDGLNGHPFTLTGSRHLTATQASVAAIHIRALPLGSRGLGAHSCPMDDARASILVFSYPGRADVGIWERTSGCGSTDNGHIASGDF